MIVSFLLIFIEHKQKINSYSSKQIITTKLDIALILTIYKDLEKLPKNKTLNQGNI